MKIYLFHARAGHGHFAVAKVIEKAFLESGVSQQDVIVEDALESASRVFQISYPAVYYYSVKYTPAVWGWFYETFDIPWVYSLVKPIRTTANRFEGARLLRRMEQEQPEFIICTHFYSAELFARAKREGRIKSKLITVVTDFYPHTFWVNEGTDIYWIMSEEGKQDLLKRGVPEERILAEGIPVDKCFHPQGKKDSLLQKYGMENGRFTILMTSGSFGLGPQAEILRELDAFHEKIQCFVVCGNNREMADALNQNKYRFPVKVFGFIDFMPDLMEASDLMVAKSGGSTTVESLAKNLPMVVLHPIPGQETRNADLLKCRNASFFMEKPDQIGLILKNIFSEAALLDSKRAAIQKLAKPYATDKLIKFVLEGRLD